MGDLRSAIDRQERTHAIQTNGCDVIVSPVSITRAFTVSSEQPSPGQGPRHVPHLDPPLPHSRVRHPHLLEIAVEIHPVM